MIGWWDSKGRTVIRYSGQIFFSPETYQIKHFIFHHQSQLITIKHRINLLTLTRTFSCTCSLCQYDGISRWCWRRTGTLTKFLRPGGGPSSILFQPLLYNVIALLYIIQQQHNYHIQIYRILIIQNEMNLRTLWKEHKTLQVKFALNI